MISSLSIISSTFDQMPNQAGFIESFTLDLSGSRNEDGVEPEAVACKLRALNTNNITSEWSPIVSIKLSREIRFAPGLRHFQRGDDLPNNLTKDLGAQNALRSVEEKESLYSKFFIAFLGLTKLNFLQNCEKNKFYLFYFFSLSRSYIRRSNRNDSRLDCSQDSRKSVRKSRAGPSLIPQSRLF